MLGRQFAWSFSLAHSHHRALVRVRVRVSTTAPCEVERRVSARRYPHNHEPRIVGARQGSWVRDRARLRVRVRVPSPVDRVDEVARRLEFGVSWEGHAHVAGEPSRLHGGGHVGDGGVGEAGSLWLVLWHITLGEQGHDDHQDEEHSDPVERRRLSGCTRYLFGGVQDG